MCGICAVFGLFGESTESKAYCMTHLENMSKGIAHRGPDSSGQSLHAFGGEGHVRLALNGKASGAQPIINDGMSLLVNGEIWNNLKLRRELKNNVKFTTESDCEIIMHLFRERPETFINDLNGMFSFVLRDTRTDQIIIARDHGGILPMFWSSSKAIDMEELKKTDLKRHDTLKDREINGFTTWDNLAYTSVIPLGPSIKCVASDMRVLQDEKVCTVFEQFPPGHYFIGSAKTGAGKLVEWYRPQWKVDPEFMPPLKPYEQCVEEYRRLCIKTTIEQWTMRDSTVKAIIPISGGVDSSSIGGILQAYQNIESIRQDPSLEGKLWVPKDIDRSLFVTPYTKFTGPIHTCCTGLKAADGTILSEDVLEARKVVALIGSIHHEFLYTIEEAMESFSKVTKILETSWVTTNRAAMLQRLMARDLRKMGYIMVLTGSPQDEIWGGYACMKWCPSFIEFQKEIRRQVTGIYLKDVLRESKIFGWEGMEARPIFFCPVLTDYSMGEVHPLHKVSGKLGNGRIEKHLPRDALKMFMPDSIVSRGKIQLSDGQGALVIETMKSYSEANVSIEEMKDAIVKYPFNTPTTKEAYMIRQYFDKAFPSSSSIRTIPTGATISCSSTQAMVWNPDFAKCPDDSGLSVKVCS